MAYGLGFGEIRAAAGGGCRWKKRTTNERATTATTTTRELQNPINPIAKIDKIRVLEIGDEESPAGEFLAWLGSVFSNVGSALGLASMRQPYAPALMRCRVPIRFD